MKKEKIEFCEDLMRPNSKQEFLLDDLFKVSIDSNVYASIRYRGFHDGKLILIIEPFLSDND